MSRLLIILFFWSIISCKGQPKNIESKIVEEASEIVDSTSLDKLLKCDRMDIRNGHYRIPDYGCVYAPKNGNELGNADVVLIPMTKIFDTNNVDKKCNGEVDCLNDVYTQINSLSIDEIKNNFNAVVFVIDKNYLKKTPQLDQSYNPTIPYKITPYILKEGKWSTDNPYELKDDKSLLHENKWKDRYIDSLAQNINEKKDVDSKNQSISENWIGNYNTYFNYGDIGGENAGWELNIEIYVDSIIASGDGYQMGFKDELIFEDLGEKLILYHKKNLYGYKLGEKMKPEFIIQKKDNEYFILSEWISDVKENPMGLGYRLEKID